MPKLGEFRAPPFGRKWPARALFDQRAAKRTRRNWCDGSPACTDIQLTVAVGRDRRLRKAIDKIRSATRSEFRIVGWSEELPRLLRASHLADQQSRRRDRAGSDAPPACPMIVNHVIPGQEEGNARYLMETNSRQRSRLNHEAVIAAVQNAFANDAALWHEWSRNIVPLGRPDRRARHRATFSSSL